jgi:putative phosphoesterase
MKIAVLSDIHGNMVALEAVLEDLEEQGNADCIVVPGDMFAFGTAPIEVLNTLQQLPNAHFLMGNTDRYLLEGTYPAAANGNGWQDKLLLSFPWTAGRLGREGVSFLKTLPPYQIIRDGDWHMLAVHGSPRSDEEGLTVETPAEDIAHMRVTSEVGVIVCGHTHVQMDRTINRIRVVNAGSIGIPFDGDPRASYAIISNLAGYGEGLTQVKLRRVQYDVEKAVAEYYDLNHPAADISAYNLRTGRSMGSGLIYTPEMRHHHEMSAVPLP